MIAGKHRSVTLLQIVHVITSYITYSFKVM